MIKYCTVPAGNSAAALVVTDRGLAHIRLSATVLSAERAVYEVFPDAVPDSRILPEFRRQWRDYFRGRPVDFKVDLDLSALGAFQRAVLAACARIPYGATSTYGQLAQEVGAPRAARAVGGALARNPVPIVVPCHRVLAACGALGGFSAEQGLQLKRRLLDLEAAGLKTPCTRRARCTAVP